MEIISNQLISLPFSFLAFITSFCKKKEQHVIKSDTLGHVDLSPSSSALKTTEINDIEVEKSEKKEEKQVEVEDDIFTSVDFTKKVIYLNSQQISDLLVSNQDKLSAAKEIQDKVFYFSRMERFPIYGIKKRIVKELENVYDNESDEVLLQILNVLEFEITKDFYIRHFYRCKELYYKLISARVLLERLNLYETYYIFEQHRCVYKDIENFFLQRGKDANESVNIRADCLDALLMYAYEMRIKKDVQAEIDKMGNLYTENRDQTIYTNSQNVHSKGIQRTAIASLKNLSFMHHPESNLDELYQLIILKLSDDSQKRDKVMKSLKRILIDPSRINGLNISQILSIVWKEIQRQVKYKAELESRLIEELYEADDTCTSGFFTRILNVLSGFSPLVKISISSEEDAVVKITNIIKKHVSKLSSIDKERLTLEILDTDPDPSSFRLTLKEEVREIIQNEESLRELKEEIKSEKWNEIVQEKLDNYFGK
jgi:hypothetical protein